jgi:hypothetical protein
MDYGLLYSEISSLTEGIPGREIAKLGVAWQFDISCVVN